MIARSNFEFGSQIGGTARHFESHPTNRQTPISNPREKDTSGLRFLLGRIDTSSRYNAIPRCGAPITYRVSWGCRFQCPLQRFLRRLQIWQSLSREPRSLFGIARCRLPRKGQRRRQQLAQLNREGKSLSLHYGRPVWSAHKWLEAAQALPRNRRTYIAQPPRPKRSRLFAMRAEKEKPSIPEWEPRMARTASNNDPPSCHHLSEAAICAPWSSGVPDGRRTIDRHVLGTILALVLWFNGLCSLQIRRSKIHAYKAPKTIL